MTHIIAFLLGGTVGLFVMALLLASRDKSSDMPWHTYFEKQQQCMMTYQTNHDAGAEQKECDHV